MRRGVKKLPNNKTEFVPSEIEILPARSKASKAVSTRIRTAAFAWRFCDAVIRVYDAAGNVIETHQHRGDFKEW